MLMLKQKLNARYVDLTILLSLIVLALLTPLAESADGLVNVAYYPNGYNITSGTYLSGAVPASIQAVDQDYIVANSSGSATSANAYSPGSYTLLGSTALVSGAVQDLASDDSVYMAFRSYENISCVFQYYNSSNAESSTTSLAYVDKLALKFTPSSAGNYLIIASAGLKGSSNAYSLQVQMTIDGTTYANPTWQPDDPNTWESFFTSKVINLNMSAHTIRMQYASEDAAQIVTIRNARIMALFLLSYEANEVETEQAVSSGAYVDIVSKAFTPSTPGVYLIVATAEVNAASTAYSLSTMLEIDGVAKDTMVTEGEAVNDYEIFAAHNVTALSAAAHTVKIRASRETTGTMYIRRARITAVRLSDSYDYQASGSEQLSSTTSTTWVDKTVLTFTPSTPGEYLVMASAKISLTTSSAGNQPAVNLTMDGAQIGYWQAGLSDATDFLTFATMINTSLSAVPHTFRIAYRTTNAFYAASIRDARIVAVRLARQYVTEVEFTGACDDYNWAQLAIGVDSSWTTSYVTVYIQAYDYRRLLYPVSGQTCAIYASSVTPNTDETHTLYITDNPTDYRNSTGNWKLRIKGVRNTSNQPVQFDFRIDQVEFRPTHYSEYSVASEFLFSSMTPNAPDVLNFTIVEHNSITGVTVTIQIWDYSASAYATSGQAFLQHLSSEVNETLLLKIDANPQFFTSAGNAKIRISGTLSTTIQYWQMINQVKLDHSHVNSSPTLNPIGNKLVGELTQLTFTATAVDTDIPAQPLTFTLGSNAPVGASITENGVFTWVPAEEQGPGNYLFAVVVSDGFLTDSEEITITVFEAHIHDLAIINAAISTTDIVSGEVVTISATVKNLGTVKQTFNLTIFCDQTVIETRTISELAPEDQQTSEFSWNTTGLSDSTYQIRAEASRVSGELETSNNSYVVATLKVGGQSWLSLYNWIIVPSAALLIVLGLFLFVMPGKRRKRGRAWFSKKDGSFSAQFGMKHKEMTGKKMLLEIDPASDYGSAISSFISETKKNDESLFIVTNQNSALHSMFPSTENANFFLLTSKTHYPQQINQKETLLPASDVSILLDACVKAQESHHDKTLNLLFDNISDIILRCGSDKTYQFIRLLLEALSRSKTTALFVFIPTAHDQVTSSSIRGLFQTQLKYTKDGPKA
jgi:hypothetical protein